MDPAASVTSRIAAESEEAPATEEIVIEEAIDLSPADLPDVGTLVAEEPLDDDIPSVPDDMPAADTPPAGATE
jgi:hypothetical protein